MKILLINPPYFGIEDDRLEQNLGLAYIASYLRQNGFENTEIIEMTGTSDMEEALKKLSPADVYGLSCYTTTYSNVKSIISYIIAHINSQAYIFVGGPHPSALPKQTLLESGADAVITGEGEQAALMLMQKLRDGQPIRGIIYGQGVEHLDCLPYPLRLLPKDAPFTRTFQGKRTMSMIATRGCPFSCVHCNSTIMGGGSKGIRSRSIENILGEIRYLKRLGFWSFRFNDDNFLAHAQIVELLRQIAKEGIEFRIFGHLQYLTDEICRLLRQSGCQFVSIGIESLNPKNLKFLHKYNNIIYLHHLENAKKYGLTIRASFMVGLPFDTNESIEYFFKKSAQLSIQEFAVYPLIPYPGTQIAIHAEKYHYKIMNTDYDHYMQMGIDGDACYVLGFDDPEIKNSFTPDDVKYWKQRADALLAQAMLHMKYSDKAR